MSQLLLQKRWDLLPEVLFATVMVKDGSSLTMRDVAFLVSNGFVRCSRKSGSAYSGGDDFYHAEYKIMNIPLRVLLKLPRQDKVQKTRRG